MTLSPAPQLKPSLLLVGASGHAKVLIDIVERAGGHRIVGLLDLDTPVGTRILDHELLGRPDDIAAIATRLGATHVLVAVGDNAARERLTAEIRRAAPFLEFALAVHPSAVIGRDVRLGAGSVVMAGAVINPSCSIGEGCVINTGARIDHDSRVEDFASVAPGAVTGGNCSIGKGAWLGIGAVLIQGVSVGAGSIVGAGSTVLRSLPPRSVAYGTPARVVRTV